MKDEDRCFFPSISERKTIKKESDNDRVEMTQKKTRRDRLVGTSVRTQRLKTKRKIAAACAKWERHRKNVQNKNECKIESTSKKSLAARVCLYSHVLGFGREANKKETNNSDRDCATIECKRSFAISWCVSFK